MKVSVSALPFTDLTLTLKATTYDTKATKPVNPSENITVTAGMDTAKFTTASSSGYL
jgi:hypothetical protein